MPPSMSTKLMINIQKPAFACTGLLLFIVQSPAFRAKNPEVVTKAKENMPRMVWTTLFQRQ